MTRTAALLLALAAAATGDPAAAGNVVLVDGREIPGALRVMRDLSLPDP